MTDDRDLHDRFGEVIGLAQAMRRIASAIVVRFESELEKDLLNLLERLSLEMAEIQGSCDSVVAGHSLLRPGRVTTRAREIKARTIRPALEVTGTLEMLVMLTLVADRALIGWRRLAMLHAAASDPPMAGLVTRAIQLHEHRGDELARHVRARGGGE